MSPLNWDVSRAEARIRELENYSMELEQRNRKAKAILEDALALPGGGPLPAFVMKRALAALEGK